MKCESGEPRFTVSATSEGKYRETAESASWKFCGVFRRGDRAIPTSHHGLPHMEELAAPSRPVKRVEGDRERLSANARVIVIAEDGGNFLTCLAISFYAISSAVR